MIGKNIDRITEEDLQSLVDGVVERKTLDYKQALPGNSDEDKVKFLADVSSFANASGGDLLYGIVEDRDTGLPEKLEGFAAENIDQEILRLGNMVTWRYSETRGLSKEQWTIVSGIVETHPHTFVVSYPRNQSRSNEESNWVLDLLDKIVLEICRA